MTTIIAELKLALANHPTEPLEVVDPASNRVYVLIEKDEYLKLRCFMSRN